ncbi:outer membrane beta-barrel protein [Flavobacterium rakeshii]|uniref:Outer membrane beta-barrel protein n=1 Tax=Flavobacterium rakeshii TaxID=1038845 RepID=A0A6N8HG42_9FLAO|nr:outer membrane beta-barrel protein [Flavobacterium rakeshii]MUV04668.1 outer membrane beta-barrel protein [Flavobacterium rakeshii]
MKNYKLISKSISSISFIGLWIMLTGNINAQEQDKSFSEVTISVGGPTTSLNYEVTGGDVSNQIGLNFGLDYTFFFSDNFGLSLGAEYQRFNTTAKAQNIPGTYETTDFEGESFEFRYTMRRFKEEQKLDFVNIPLMLVYQNQEYDFYIKAGTKIGLPVSGKFKSNFNLSASGYYPQYDGELFDPAFMGFGDFDDVKADGDIDVKPTYIASFEFGVKQPIGKGNLYAGFYFDYGLNDIADKKSRPVDYTVNDSGASFGYNSVLNTEYVDQLKTMAFGIKLRYSIFNF